MEVAFGGVSVCGDGGGVERGGCCISWRCVYRKEGGGGGENWK